MVSSPLGIALRIALRTRCVGVRCALGSVARYSVTDLKSVLAIGLPRFWLNLGRLIDSHHLGTDDAVRGIHLEHDEVASDVAGSLRRGFAAARDHRRDAG